MKAPPPLHYSLTSKDQIKGCLAHFDDAEYGKLMIRNTRISAGAMWAALAALAYFVTAPVDPLFANILAVTLVVVGVVLVAFAKPLARDTYRWRLTRLAKRTDIGSQGSHIATIRDDGLQEQFDGGTVLIPWTRLKSVTEIDDFYLINVDRGGFFLIPKQPDPRATAAFIAAFREREA